MFTRTYLQILKDSFQFLFEKQKCSVVHHVAADPFMNAQTYLQNEDLIFQVMNDWCQISLDIKPYDSQKPLKKQLNEFHSFNLVLTHLEIPEKKELDELYKKVLDSMFCDDSDWCNMVEEDKGAIQMELIAKILDKYYDQIQSIFTKDLYHETKIQLANLKKQL